MFVVNQKLIFSILMLTNLVANAQKATTTTPQQVQTYVRNWHATPDMQHASLSFVARTVKNEQIKIEYEPSQSIAPASCLKLVTSAAALGILGENFRFETRLAYDGTLKNGILDGNLYIIGGGDPSLGTADLEKLMQEWVQAVKKLNIRQIKGKIIGDESIFEAQNTPDSWTWADMGNYYGAGAAGLSINDNLFQLTFRTGKKAGEATQILKTVPEVEGIEWINEVKTDAAGTGDQAYVYGAPYTYLRYVRGTLPVNPQNSYSIKASLPDPALFCAYYFRKKLQAAGISSVAATTIRLLNIQNQAVSKTRTPFHTTFSAPLKDILKPLNQKSINLYAENLARYIGYRQRKKGTLAAGIEAITEFWKNKRIDLKGFYMEDACGLSRFNYLTAKQLTEILIQVHKMPQAKAFYESLAVAGKSGTLQYRCLKTAAENNLHAKSGSLGKVRSFAGYVTTRSGQLVAFSILLNNYDAKDSEVMKNLEKIMVMLAELK